MLIARVLHSERFDSSCIETPSSESATPTRVTFTFGYAHTALRGNAGAADRADLRPRRGARGGASPNGASLWGLGERATWISGLVLALSALTGWYAGSGEGVNVAVLGWHTGVLGKLVFFIGLAAILVVVLRQFGLDLPAAVPESLIVIALGALSTIFVLVRAISIPDEFFFAHRGMGLWISLAASLALIGAGLLQASEEL